MTDLDTRILTKILTGDKHGYLDIDKSNWIIIDGSWQLEPDEIERVQQIRAASQDRPA